VSGRRNEDDRDAVIAQARQRNPQAFAPWTKDEEKLVRKRHEAGESIPSIGYAAFAVSRTGTLAYSNPFLTRGELTWFSRDGRRIGDPVAPAADYITFTLSPDSSRLAMSRIDPQTDTGDIWLFDFTRGSMTRLTADPMNDASPFSSPDGSRILFRSNRMGLNDLFAKPANGSRPEELIYKHGEPAATNMIPTDYSRDGSHLLFTNTGVRSSFDVWALSMAPTPRATVVLETVFNEYQAVLSPDGRWMAYVSEETGAPQVYVQSFPGGEQRWQVSSEGEPSPSGEPMDERCTS
jgi:eukaryotic-like serine/threonine-protein kinase